MVNFFFFRKKENLEQNVPIFSLSHSRLVAMQLNTFNDTLIILRLKCTRLKFVFIAAHKMAFGFG